MYRINMVSYLDIEKFNNHPFNSVRLHFVEELWNSNEIVRLFVLRPTQQLSLYFSKPAVSINKKDIFEKITGQK